MVSGSPSDAGSFSVLCDAVCASLDCSDVLQNAAAGSEPRCLLLPCSLSTNKTEPEMPEEEMVKIIQVITDRSRDT